MLREKFEQKAVTVSTAFLVVLGGAACNSEAIAACEYDNEPVTVETGDALYDMTGGSHIAVRATMKHNDIEDARDIQPGDKIYLAEDC